MPSAREDGVRVQVTGERKAEKKGSSKGSDHDRADKTQPIAWFIARLFILCEHRFESGEEVGVLLLAGRFLHMHRVVHFIDISAVEFFEKWTG